MNNLAVSVREICERLCKYSAENRKLLIFCHQNPDGDTVGSAFALKLIYNSLGGAATCVCAGEAPQYLHFLYRDQKEIFFDLKIDGSDVLCAVDVASPGQLGDYGYLADRFDFMIDHHKTGKPFADCWVEPSASACGELIFKLYRMLTGQGKIAPDARISARLYAAISADTGSFKFSNTTPETHLIARELMEEINGSDKNIINCAEIAHKLHDSKSIGELAAQKCAIENLRFACDGRLAYIYISAEIMENGGFTEADMGSIIDICRGIEGVMVGVTVKQPLDKKNILKISSRSNCDINVAEICAKFGGGGHVKAAGATVDTEDIDKTLKEIISAFTTALENTEEGNTNEPQKQH